MLASSLEEKTRHLAELYDTARQFVDQVSDQVGKPLAVIREFTSILADGIAGPLNAEQAQYLGIVVGQVEELHLRVRDMLDLRRMDAGLIRAVRGPCRLEAILDGVAASLTRKAHAQQATLSVRCPDPLPDAYADPELLGRLLTNVGGSALAGLADGGSLELCARLEPSGDQLSIAFESLFEDESSGRSDAESLGIDDDGLVEWPDGSLNNGLHVEVARRLARLTFGELVFSAGRKGILVPRVVLPVFAPDALSAAYVRSQFLGRRPSHLSLLRGVVPASIEPSDLARMDDFLQHLVRSRDWVFHPAPGAWLLTVAGTPLDLDRVVDRIRDEWTSAGYHQPHHPWPELRLNILGSWPLHDSAEEYRQRFRLEVRSARSAAGDEQCLNAPSRALQTSAVAMSR